MSFKFGLAIVSTFVGAAMMTLAMQHDLSKNSDGTARLNRDTEKSAAGCVYLYPSGAELYSCLMRPYGQYR